ncbi:proliferating cell nuclear antigen (pcna) [Candidatus Micrarchaeota archaeon]|nr:proliferating cell nuclear antigen (pcna) [Candidatus Micrarchaeota archaeon]MBU2476044.1 proliferating cell nuclear antigen (pcna) [Candidatus Micrarchaeota archaeon]
MKLVLDNAVEFKKAIDAVSVLIDEAELIVSKDGLKLKAADPSQISMIDFKMPKEAFSEYKVESETKIGIDLDYLSQVLNRSKSSEKLILELDEKDSRLKIQLKDSSVRSFSVPLIEISSSDLPTPKIEFDAEVKATAGLIQDGLKDAVLVSTHVTLGVTSKNFFIKAGSSKGDSANEITKDDKNLKELNAKKECYAMFPLSYLQDMLKAASSDTEVHLYLKTNAPVKITYAIGKAEIEYFLAPRIESS